MLVTTKVEADHTLVTTDIVAESAGFDALRDEWKELLENSSASCLFLTWEWLRTWWEHLGENRRLCIVTLRSEGKLCAIAPLGLCPPAPSRLRLLSSIEFIGSGNIGSDYLDFIVREGWESVVEEVLAARLIAFGRPAEWTQLSLNGSVTRRIAGLLAQGGWRILERKTNVCPFICLAGETWESYLGRLGGEHRYGFHRKWRRLNRDYAVRLGVVGTELQCEEAIAQLIAAHNRRWRDRGGSNAFNTPAVIAFHHEFARLSLHRGWLRMYVLHLNDKPVAWLYGFLYNNKFYFYQSGFDGAYESNSLGTVMMGLAIKSAIEEGAQEFDLLHGDELYKLHWASRSRDLGRVEAYPPGVIARMCQGALETARASRSIVRRISSEAFSR
jgi:CelD/BcsL family acetyltransferase involved in cellulose biosynthesis